ncbi:hypothetical protein Bhyg_09503, partial [Pseudolycoriella hygida]
MNCFVPYCQSKKNIGGIPIHFFQVPQGSEGDRWKDAVNYDESQIKKRIGILRLQVSPSVMYCCEVHFNVESDCKVTMNGNGSVKCDIKRGVLPNIIPNRSKRLWHLLEMNSVET